MAESEMTGNALLLEIDRSRVEGLTNGAMAVQLPNGTLVPFGNLSEAQQQQLHELKQEKAPEVVIYVWSIDAVGVPDEVENTTLDQWLKT